MSDQRLRTVILPMPDGERIALSIEASSGLPHVDFSRYVLLDRRAKRACSTTINDFAALAILEEWAANRGINLSERLRGLTSFSAKEISDLVLRLRERRHATSKSRVVSDGRWVNRVDAVRAYFKFEFGEALHRLAKDNSRYGASLDKAQRVLTQLKRDRPVFSSSPRVGLPPRLVERLFFVTGEDHPENPWEDNVRKRNRMMILLLCCLGMRLGELLSLRLSDVRSRGGLPEVDIRHHPIDPNDSRKIQPGLKTLGRRLPIGRTLAKACDDYIQNARLTNRASLESDYLVLSREGKPLSARAAQAVVQRLRLRHSEFTDLCPHQLRNTWSDEVQQLLASSGLNAHQAHDVHTYMGGWVSNSEQPLRYSRGWLNLQAQKIGMLAQDSFFARDN
tara:strand:- start:4135 stop:5313 length:1179 start_codon:yes stop_codon:yes gene_type:complete